MSFLAKISQFFKGVGTFLFALEKVKVDPRRKSIAKKPQDPILEELIKMQKEIKQLKERVKTLEQNHDTLCEDVDHLYELI